MLGTAYRPGLAGCRLCGHERLPAEPLCLWCAAERGGQRLHQAPLPSHYAVAAGRARRGEGARAHRATVAVPASQAVSQAPRRDTGRG